VLVIVCSSQETATRLHEETAQLNRLLQKCQQDMAIQRKAIEADRTMGEQRFTEAKAK
jgi:hypothetical protein